MLNQGPAVASTPSLFRILIDATFSGISTSLRRLMDGIREEVTQSNSLQVLVDWAAYFSPQLREQVNLAAMPAQIADMIKNGKVQVVEALKNPAILSLVEMQIEELPSMLVEQMKKEVQVSISDMLRLASPQVGDLVRMMLSRSAELNASLTEPTFQLLTALFATPDANAMLRSINIEEVVVAIQRDQQALRGLERLCAAFGNLAKTLMNDPEFIEQSMSRMHVWSDYNALVTEPMKEDLKRTSTMLSEFLLGQVNKTHLNALNQLKPFKDYQIQVLNDFVNSASYKAILGKKEVCRAFDTQLQLMKGAAMYEAYKSSSPEIAACLTKIEMDMAAGAVKVEEEAKATQAPITVAREAVRRQPSATVANPRRRAAAANDVVLESSEEEEKKVQVKRSKRGGK